MTDQSNEHLAPSDGDEVVDGLDEKSETPAKKPARERKPNAR